jgi:hypothetical protein
MKFLIICILILQFTSISAGPINVVRIHYDGGGDWYGNKTTWVNILERFGQEFDVEVASREVAYKITDPKFRQFPIAYIAGHGNIRFSEEESRLLRLYLTSGGFLYADDDYGMDKSFRKAMKTVFPELNFVELPFKHPIYQIHYSFNNGLPKIHEHDGGPPKGYGLISEGRLVCFYSMNTDISDGCEDEGIHDDSSEVREQAMRMAVNILLYAILN